jgi:hypothetical protein
VFQTSDDRFDDRRNLGTHSTWVKWAQPTAEALRQACLARQTRLHQAEPQLPAITITSLEISISTFLGSVDLQLNPQFTCLIGGRVRVNPRFWNTCGGHSATTHRTPSLSNCRTTKPNVLRS